MIRGLRRTILLLGAPCLLAGVVGETAAFDPLQRAERAAESSLRSLAAGDTAAAIEQMLRAQALAPDDPEIRHALGEVFYRGGAFESARRQFESLVEGPLDPRRESHRRAMEPASTFYNAANAAFRMKEFQSALDLYTRALLALPEGSQPGDDLLHNLELTQKILEQGESSEQSQPGESSEDPQQDSRQQESEDSQPSESQSQEQPQDPSQPQEPPDPEDSEQPESRPDSTQTEPTPADSAQAPPPPPDSLSEATAESLRTLPEGMTAAEAMRLLEALDHEEEELRRSIQRRLRGGETESEREW